MSFFPQTLFTLGPIAVSDTMVSSLLLSMLLLIVGRLLVTSKRARASAEVGYDFLEQAVVKLTAADAAPLVPLVLTQWLFIGAANLVGVLPTLQSPTRDLSITAALAVISFVGGHLYAWRVRGIGYLKSYIEPNPILLPFNIIGEVSRTIALALRLFGNMLSGTLIGAIVLALAGLLVPVPLQVMSLLTGVVQAYIFGVLTLVFAASSLTSAKRADASPTPPSPSPPAVGA